MCCYCAGGLRWPKDGHPTFTPPRLSTLGVTPCWLLSRRSFDRLGSSSYDRGIPSTILNDSDDPTGLNCETGSSIYHLNQGITDEERGRRSR